MKVYVARSSIRAYEWEIEGVFYTEQEAWDQLDGVYGACHVSEYEVRGTKPEEEQT